MGLITKEVLAKPNSRYVKLGYEVFTKEGKGHVCKCETLLGKNKIFDFDKYIKVKFEDLPNHSTIPLEIECDNCHKIFITNKDNLMRKKEFKNNGIWYCGSCAHHIYTSGENNYRWDKNRTWEKRDKQRATHEYAELKRKIFKRDNFQCQICGNHAEIMHHLDSVNLFPYKMYDATNVISLCQKCHSTFHHEYGRGNNTKHQFEEWSNKIFQLSDVNNYEFVTAKQVYCFETNKIYHSTRICEIELNFKKGSVYACCTLLRNQYKHKNYHFIYYDEIKNMNEHEIAEYYADKIDKHRITQKCFIDLQTGIIYETKKICFELNNIDISKYKVKKYDENSYKTERFIPNYLYNELKLKNILQLDNISFYFDRRK